MKRKRAIHKALHKPVPNGKWLEPVQHNYLIGCCDCGLVHWMDFRIVDGEVQYRMRRAEGHTRTARIEMARKGM